MTSVGDGSAVPPTSPSALAEVRVRSTRWGARPSPAGPAPEARTGTGSGAGGAAVGGEVRLDDAILEGLAPDGGLYLPTTVPPLPDGWRDATSPGELAAAVLAPWWGGAAHEVAPLLRDAVDFEVPLRAIGGNRWLLELFHGPTLSFKDVGARSMARLAGRALERRGGTATVLVATSGDTGSAVADGFAGVPNVRVVLLYPRGKVSEVQERQLVAAREGVRAYAVDGDFDDCQRLVKAAFRDPALREVGLTSANSINVGRLLPQMVYYLWAAVQLRRLHGVREAPRFVVPSGNLGNLTAGVLAQRAGLEVAGWVAAHNANAFVPEHVAGRRAAFDFRDTIATLSNAMDVGAPSNFERLHALFGDGLGGRVDALSVDDDATRASMRRARAEDGLFVDPHTAVGLEALRRLRSARSVAPGNGTAAAVHDEPTIVLATAHPAKFPDAVREATGEEPPGSPALDALRRRPARSDGLPADEAALREALLEG